MTRTKITAALAALALTTAACSTPTAGTEQSPARSAGIATMTDDRVIADDQPTHLERQEQAFRDTTCELLDDDYTVENVMLGSVMADKPFDDERAGELIAEAIMTQCPEYEQDMLDTLDALGY